MTIRITVCPSIPRGNWATSRKVPGSIPNSATGVFPMCAAYASTYWQQFVHVIEITNKIEILKSSKSIFSVQNYIKQVKVTLVQALRLCTGRTAYRGVEVQLYPFMTTALDRGEGSAARPGRSLPPGERPGTHRTGGWVGPRAGLDRCAKSRPHRDSIPGSSSPQPVAIPTTLPGPHIKQTLTFRHRASCILGQAFY